MHPYSFLLKVSGGFDPELVCARCHGISLRLIGDAENRHTVVGRGVSQGQQTQGQAVGLREPMDPGE